MPTEPLLEFEMPIMLYMALQRLQSQGMISSRLGELRAEGGVDLAGELR